MSKFFVGAHGTGKSTILEGLKKLREKGSIPCERTFFTEGISRPVNKALEKAQIEHSANQKQIMINDLTVAQYLVQVENPFSLCTRSIIDIIVYSSVVFPELNISEYQAIFNDTAHKIDTLFYLPIEFDLKTDDVRNGVWGDVQIQKDIDSAFRNFLHNHRSIINKVVTIKGTKEERVEMVSQFL